MTEITTQGHEILVDPDTGEEIVRPDPGGELVSWIVGTVQPWKDHRDLHYLKSWAEFWRLWRGQWAPEDKNRDSERSRLIAPALSQAIEMAVAEIEESVLSKAVWFDVADDIRDEDKLDATMMRDQLLEDMDEVEVRDVISEAVLVAAIFGTGTIKVNTVVKPVSGLERNQEGDLVAIRNERVVVSYESYRPDQVIPDPAGRSVDECMGVALETRTTVAAVLEMIEQGTYLGVSARQLINSNPDNAAFGMDPDENLSAGTSSEVLICEYHGKVPAKYLMKLKEAESPLDELVEMEADDMGDEAMVEAIVTVANNSVLLRAMANPYVLKDRTVIMFPWEKVPGRLWGRGVAEKGYNPQKALDAELRARTDALGFVSAPMLGLDAGRIPRGFKPEVKPGKIWLTNGDPSEVLRPVVIGQLEPNTFNHTSELTQMVQMGTGALDTASAIRGDTSSGGNGANSNSMMMGAFVKRSKRAIQNVSRKLLEPLIRKTALRYLQFAPSRYPFDDTTFFVKATLGLVAREMEQVNLTQLIGMLPEEGISTKLEAAKGFVDLSSVLNKADIVKAIAADKEQAAKMQEAQQQMEQQKSEQEAKLAEMAMEGETLKNQKTLAEIRRLLAQAESEERLVDVKEIMAVLDQQRVQIQAAEIGEFGRANDLQDRRLDLQEEQLDIKRQELSIKKRGL